MYEDFERLRKDPFDRRAFLKRMSAAGLGVAAAALLANPPKAQAYGRPIDQTGSTFFPSIPGNNINEIVTNFALTLEILEADLYRQALNAGSGYPIDKPLIQNPNGQSYTLKVPSGGLSTPFMDAGWLYLLEFTYVEAAHRDFLISVLNSIGAPVQTPNPGGYAFPGGPSNNLKGLLTQLLPLEATGVRAYLGAVPYYNNFSTFAQTAATIYSTEARHTAAINYTVGKDPGPAPRPGDQKVTPKYPAPNTFEYYLTPKEVLKVASAYFV